jgi:hypothetical protein
MCEGPVSLLLAARLQEGYRSGVGVGSAAVGQAARVAQRGAAADAIRQEL